MIYVVEIASCGVIYIPSFMQMGRGVQEILRFSSAILMSVMLIILIERNYEMHI
jgi:hypothetical protein